MRRTRIVHLSAVRVRRRWDSSGGWLNRFGRAPRLILRHAATRSRPRMNGGRANNDHPPLHHAASKRVHHHNTCSQCKDENDGKRPFGIHLQLLNERSTKVQAKALNHRSLKFAACSGQQISPEIRPLPFFSKMQFSSFSAAFPFLCLHARTTSIFRLLNTKEV